MLGIRFACFAAFVLGGFLGYILSWAKRLNPKPDAKEVATLAGIVLGGGAISLVHELIRCPSALEWYIVGLPVGYAAYLGALKLKWDTIVTAMNAGRLQGVPFSPLTFH